MNNTTLPLEHDAHPDPIVDTADAPAVASGTSNAAGGAAAGAVAGTVVAGPVGTVVGAALGAIAGSLTGLSDAEPINPPLEQAYWRTHFANRPYVENGSSFDDYGPAFAYGVSAYAQYAGRSFDAIETDLSHGWNTARGVSVLDWDHARIATRDAWNRVSDASMSALTDRSDRHGK